MIPSGVFNASDANGNVSMGRDSIAGFRRILGEA